MKVEYKECDLCHVKTDENQEWPKWNCIGDEDITRQEVNFYWYGQREVGTKTESIHAMFDVCPKCFNTTIVKFMLEHGAKLREEKNSW